MSPFKSNASAAILLLIFALITFLPASAALPRIKLSGFAEALGLPADPKTNDFTVQEIASDAPANILWPGDAPGFTFQFTNKTANPIEATGTLAVIQYGTNTDPGDYFLQNAFKIADCGSMPLGVALAPHGFANVTVTPTIPAAYGGYALVADLGSHGRDFAAACVRVPKPADGKQQYPTFSLDARDGSAEEFAMFKRLGIKATRMEVGYTPTASPDYQILMDKLAAKLALAQQNDVTVMITLGAPATNTIMPLGRPRGLLDNNTQMRPGKADCVWLPQYDDDFQTFCRQLAGRFGWPKGPVNAVELWNEPWDGVSISGWGADIPRYRELYTHMAQGIEAARQLDGVTVLIGGACSSMNTEDKLFSDGKDTFLKWLDFTSIHYQPLGAEPALVPAYVNRKSPYGPVRAWDTESWMANSEDRVAVVIASMRTQGLSRTSGVYHYNVREIQNIRVRQDKGVTPATVIQTMAPAAAIAATQSFIGPRPFKQLLFQNGLPWVFEFDGLKGPEDGTLVVVGDLGGVYEPTSLLFHSVTGLNNLAHSADMDALRLQIAALPATATADTRSALVASLKRLQVLDGATLTIPDHGGRFILYDFYGNPLPSHAGTITVPLNGLGYFLRTDGSAGSFGQLTDAIASARIEGYEPLDIVAHDLLAKVSAGPTLRLTLTNILNRPVSGALSVKLGELTLTNPNQTVSFQPHETRDILYPVTAGAERPDNTYPLTVHFDAGVDGIADHIELMHVNVISHRTIQINGNLDQWQGTFPQTFRSDGLSGPSQTEKAWLPFLNHDQNGDAQGYATIHLAYDANNLYFAAQIADSTPDPGTLRFGARDENADFYPDTVTATETDPQTSAVLKTDTLTWPTGVRHFSYVRRPELPSANHHDNVQIAFNVLPDDQKALLPNPPGTMPHFMMYQSNDYEYALNQVAPAYGGGTEVWRLFAPGVPFKHFMPREPQATTDGGPVTGAQLVISRDGNVRIVEAALPWPEIPEVKRRLDAGETIKFSCRVNDNSGPSYELAGFRSVSKTSLYGFHDLWTTSWTNEVEFAFEK